MQTIDFPLIRECGRNIGEVLGDVNTEAKCALVCAVPYENVAVTDVTDYLEKWGAFDSELVTRRRFQPGKLLFEMADDLMYVTNEYNVTGRHNAEKWVEKLRKPKGPSATAIAGFILGLSRDYEQPSRIIIGEKKVQDSLVDANSARLGVLATIHSLEINHHTLLTRDNVKKSAISDSGLAAHVVETHLKSLERQGLIIVSEGRLEFGETKSGLGVGDYVNDLLVFLSRIARGDDTAIKEGIDTGNEVFEETGLLGELVRQSFDSTGHTGKKIK